MVSAIVAERAPEAVKAIAEGGHEVLSHSYAMDVIPALLSDAEERANIERCTKLLEQASVQKIIGWLSPRGTSRRERRRPWARVTPVGLPPYTGPGRRKFPCPFGELVSRRVTSGKGRAAPRRPAASRRATTQCGEAVAIGSASGARGRLQV